VLEVKPRNTELYNCIICSWDRCGHINFGAGLNCPFFIEPDKVNFFRILSRDAVSRSCVLSLCFDELFFLANLTWWERKMLTPRKNALSFWRLVIFVLVEPVSPISAQNFVTRARIVLASARLPLTPITRSSAYRT